MSVIESDVLISGAGVAGLVAAVALGQAGLRVVLADPAPQVTDPGAKGADLRTTAFLSPARNLLDRLGVWPALAPHARPLATMRIVNAGGTPPEAQVSRDFRASDLGEEAFGWNLPNWRIRAALLERLEGMEGVTFLPGTGFARMFTRESGAKAWLSDKTEVRCRLIVAADGRASPVREAAGIKVRTTRYGQKALVFLVSHDRPHEDVSTEVHLSGGPFTLVPLPDHDGRSCSSVVWMTGGAEAEALAELDDEAFSRAATERSAGVQGELRLIGRRQLWPIIAQRAAAMTAERVALVAEAAHVVPPIGAQGLNMSLADIAALAELAETRPEALGSAEMLARYARRREVETMVRVAGIDMLNRASQTGQPILQELRGEGLKVMHDLAPLRRGLMRLGLGMPRGR